MDGYLDEQAAVRRREERLTGYAPDPWNYDTSRSKPFPSCATPESMHHPRLIALSLNDLLRQTRATAELLFHLLIRHLLPLLVRLLVEISIANPFV